MTDYPLYTGVISYGATGEGETSIFCACQTKSEAEFRQYFGDRLNRHYSVLGKVARKYDLSAQPPPYDPSKPSEDQRYEFPDAASWYMIGAEIWKGLPPKEHYVVKDLVSQNIWKTLARQVDIDLNGNESPPWRLGCHVEIFLHSYINCS